MSKFDMTEEELKEFVRLNKEKITEFMKEDAPEIKETIRTEASNAEENLKKFSDKASEKFKDVKEDGKEFFTAVTSPSVQKHFISAGMEFMLGFMEVFKAIPVPKSMESVTDKVSEIRTTASETFCQKNPECMRKRTVEKIEID